MAFSFVTKTGNGAERSFTFAFEGQDEGYIRESDIVATVDGVVTPFTLLSSNTLEFNVAPSNGSTILIRRVMPKDLPFADFQQGNNFGQEVLNNSFLQLLYVMHEVLDGYVPAGFQFQEDIDFLGGVTIASSDPENPTDAVTYQQADDRYVFKAGDTMEGPLDMVEYPITVRIAQLDDEPARKDELDKERADRKTAVSQVQTDYQAADASLQDQLTGETPLAASAFSVISWHDQEITNSVNIPENKNAWSFGPTVKVSQGTTITIGEGSVWTVAEGSEPTEVSSITANAPLVQSGTLEDIILDLPNASTEDAGAMSSSDKGKLDGIEAGATADQTAGEIKTAYESNANTNAFTDAYETKLNGVESGATADQTAGEIKTAYESNSDTNAFTDAEKALVGQLGTETAWAAPTLQNGWTDFGGEYQTARYMRDETGTVYVEGLIEGGTITTGTVLFNLPAGFRPAATLRMSLIDASSDTCGVNVENGGDVVAQSISNNTFVSINMVFKAS